MTLLIVTWRSIIRS